MKALKLLLAISLVTNVVLCGVLWRAAKRPSLVVPSHLETEKASFVHVSSWGYSAPSTDILTYFGQPINLGNGRRADAETFDAKGTFNIPHFDIPPKMRGLPIKDEPLRLPFREPPRSEQGLFVSPEGV